MKTGSFTLLAALLLVAEPVRAQEQHAAAPAPVATTAQDTASHAAPAAGDDHAAPAGAHAAQEAERAAGPVDIITPHITNSDHIEVPYWKFAGRQDAGVLRGTKRRV